MPKQGHPHVVGSCSAGWRCGCPRTKQPCIWGPCFGTLMCRNSYLNHGVHSSKEPHSEPGGEDSKSLPEGSQYPHCGTHSAKVPFYTRFQGLRFPRSCGTFRPGFMLPSKLSHVRSLPRYLAS